MEQTTCVLPLPSLPHGAQVSQHHGILEKEANRWSKPHVSSLSLHSLMELRSVNIMGSWRGRPTGRANHMSIHSPFTSSSKQVRKHPEGGVLWVAHLSICLILWATSHFAFQNSLIATLSREYLLCVFFGVQKCSKSKLLKTKIHLILLYVPKQQTST